MHIFIFFVRYPFLYQEQMPLDPLQHAPEPFCFTII